MHACWLVSDVLKERVRARGREIEAKEHHITKIFVTRPQVQCCMLKLAFLFDQMKNLPCVYFERKEEKKKGRKERKNKNEKQTYARKTF